MCIKLPLPPGCLPTLWQNDEKFLDAISSLPGYYVTGDGGHIDYDGYVFVMGRMMTSLMLPAIVFPRGAWRSHRSTPDVAECAVIGVADRSRGRCLSAWSCLKAGSRRNTDELVGELRADGACSRSERLRLSSRPPSSSQLPKTRSGKILRGTIRKIADGEGYRVPSTLDDPRALKEMRRVFLGATDTAT